MSVIDQFGATWTKFSLQQKVTMSVIFLAVLGSLIYLPFMVKTPEYGVLFSNISDQDAGQVVAKLKADSVPYKLGPGSKSILVPEDKVHETRLQMAMVNLPGGPVGFELFDKTNLGISDFVQELNYQRALQGELARTIMQLEEVEQARVHIVMPKESVFIEDQKEPTASIVMKMRSATAMGKKQIQGIVHLVASSVPGLKPGNITVIDNQGNVLSMGAGDDSMASLSSTQYEMVQNVEKYLESKSQTLLDKVLGPQKSIVRISVDLDFTQIKTEKETFDPEGVIRSEQVTSVNSSGGAGSEDETANNGTYSKDENVNNYEVGKTVQQIVQEVGDVKRMSVAVVVDGKYKTSEANPEEKTYIPRNDEELQKLTDLVQESVNFSIDRGDEIKVQNIPFDTSYQDELKKELDESEKKAKSSRRNEFVMNAAVKGGKFLALALVILLGLKKIADMRPKGGTAEGGVAAASGSAPVAAPGIPATQGMSFSPAPGGAPNPEADKIANNIKKTWLTS